MENVTPMMRQYLQMKEKYPGCVLFFRLGDFYEMFFEDAQMVSRELELTLTGKDCGLAERAPMCGIPFHSAATYIARLVALGHRVAVCEQLTDPALSKGLVERDVVRVVTPGTVVDADLLTDGANSFLLALCFEGAGVGMAWADVSTGELFASETTLPALPDELSRVAPREIVANDLSPLSTLDLPIGLTPPPASALAEDAFAPKAAERRALAQFHAQTLTELSLARRKLALRAVGGLLCYLADTQKNALSHLRTLRYDFGRARMHIDPTTRRNLELTQSLAEGSKRGSLLSLMDKTETAMGARLLRSWVEEPLTERDAIEARLDAVEALTREPMLAAGLAEALDGVHDLERLLSKVSYQTLNGRDCLALASSLEKTPAMRDLLSASPADALRRTALALDPLPDLTDLIRQAIHPEAPISLTEGGLIRDGYDATLDGYRDASAHGKQWMVALEATEREQTGIRNLRVQYNRVFGYYIEVTKSNLSMVPMRYVRRQTLANCERYVTPELQEMERRITEAQQQSLRLETTLFQDVRERIAREISRIQQTATAVKTLDALLSLAKIAVEYGYCRPALSDDGRIEIREGRHPVVERMMRGAPFVPNDTDMDMDDQRMLIVTGPNMAGKSTYMRQVALIVLMAHMGSFVPADEAKICLCDRVFTRIGASDDLAGGRSTFMVEMSETAQILRDATRKSLVLMDEIGRGTSTFDGLSIAWAVVEYLCDRKRCGAKTLFATHYHELSELEGRLEGVKNYRVSVREHGEEVIFLRKIVPGGADRSYGVYVAHLAGVPETVVRRAQEILARLQASDLNQNTIGENILEIKKKEKRSQLDLFSVGRDALIEEMAKLDVTAMTPMDAINTLFLMREKARKL